MGVPKKLQEADAKNDKMLKEHFEKQAQQKEGATAIAEPPAQSPASQSATPVPPAPPVEAPATHTLDNVNTSPPAVDPPLAPQVREPVQSVQPAQPVAPPSPVVPDAPVAPAAPVDGIDLSSGKPDMPGPREVEWSQRLKSLEGRINAQGDEIKNVNDENVKLREAIADRDEKINQSQNLNNARAGLTEDQLDEYGEGMVDVAARVAQSTLDPQIQELSQRLLQLQTQLTETQTFGVEQQKQAFTKELIALVPDWYELNDTNNPNTIGFRQWLHQVDPQTGWMRIDVIEQLCGKRDVERVALWVNAWRQTTVQAPPQPPTNVAPPEDLVEPTAQGVADLQAKPSKPVYSVEEFKAAYIRISRALTSGRPSAEQKKEYLEQIAALELAKREGRVTNQRSNQFAY